VGDKMKELLERLGSHVAPIAGILVACLLTLGWIGVVGWGLFSAVAYLVR
jgi:hypothetical protein